LGFNLQKYTTLDKYFSKTLFIGKQVQFMPICHSTNEVCLNLAKQSNVFEGQIVWAGHQTAGKGQMGNVWVDEEGSNLLFSLLLKPNFLLPAQQFWITKMISVAVAEALSEYIPEGILIKWPNDIFLHGRKMGGILIENSLNNSEISQSVVGIGLNINQLENLPDKATSMAIACGQPFDLVMILENILLHIEKEYLALKSVFLDNLNKRYHALLLGKDEWGSFEDSNGMFKAKVEGTSSDGRLILQTESGIERLFSLKEIRFVL
jgi:BirA family transcriptional regulator, biotin operon repressor / biotin---[acetyl-CoA-carboxylase] ligase